MEAERGQQLDQAPLAALVVRGDGIQGDQLFGQLQGRRRLDHAGQSPKVRSYWSAEKPTASGPAPSSTGRLMTDGFSSISSRALALSTTWARRSSGSLRQVVPLRLTRTSQSSCSSQRATVSRDRPCF